MISSRNAAILNGVLLSFNLWLGCGVSVSGAYDKTVTELGIGKTISNSTCGFVKYIHLHRDNLRSPTLPYNV